eukprot:PLAT1539.1.p2 GENE.PLAT1539.1~~PLAT1539.1.p2  ORF type:complete len:297 (+),score=70.38 PLAT1539.1:61-891(+)
MADDARLQAGLWQPSAAWHSHAAPESAAVAAFAAAVAAAEDGALAEPARLPLGRPSIARVKRAASDDGEVRPWKRRRVQRAVERAAGTDTAPTVARRAEWRHLPRFRLRLHDYDDDNASAMDIEGVEEEKSCAAPSAEQDGFAVAIAEEKEDKQAVQVDMEMQVDVAEVDEATQLLHELAMERMARQRARAAAAAAARSTRGSFGHILGDSSDDSGMHAHGRREAGVEEEDEEEEDMMTARYNAALLYPFGRQDGERGRAERESVEEEEDERYHLL